MHSTCNEPLFDRSRPVSKPFTFIGEGKAGGKAQGLIDIQQSLEDEIPVDGLHGITVSIPHMTVIRTDVFDLFMQQNHLYDIALSGNDDEYIAHEFQKASLPSFIVGDLRALVTNCNLPLAVRSSSMLEDSCKEPFAGVYATKMIPNNQQDVEKRFRKLTEAIKLVWSSMFFKESADYFLATGKDIRDEKMAIVIQEVIGNRYKDRYYPVVSGVGRSFNFYPTGNARPEDGVVNLALGLGKTIVDNGISWTYSPCYPAAPAPFNGIRALMNMTQTRFFAVNMGHIPEFNPIKESEFLSTASLKDAEQDGTLTHLCSSWDYENDRIVTGLYGKSARILNFSPILQARTIHLNDAILRLLDICEKKYGTHVEIEFAMMYDRETGRKPHIGFLQVRPMNVSSTFVDLDEIKSPDNRFLLEEAESMGNGIREDIQDIVFVDPGMFSSSQTREIAGEVEQLNRTLLDSKRPYLLIGFGRWGSSDSWLGIPVTWRQISGAATIVESTLPGMIPELSQGSHFFHNMIAFNVFYFTIRDEGGLKIDWEWLMSLPVENQTRHVRHVRLDAPLKVVADGRKKKGMIIR